MLLRLFSIVTVLLLISQTSATNCPSNCSCVTATFSCQVCLQYYLQVYSFETKGCQCLPGFQLTPEVVDYCHPTNCKQSNDWGCATCYPNAKIYYDNTYQYYNCSCVTNYYLNQTDDLCYCLSHRSANLYYEDVILNTCIQCPNDCTCNSSGCVSCPSNSMRLMITNQYSSTCYCKKPHLQINGSCQCAINCICYSNGTTLCNASSNRQLIVGEWVCKHPYIQSNGQCICQAPYTIVSTLGYEQCVCLSKVNYTKYYEANGICYKCGLNCTCDYSGCISCFDGSVNVNYEACICKKNYIYESPNCLCLDPFQIYVDPNSGVVSCRCLNYRLSGYYSNGDFCDKCPDGCTCNSSGCFSCSDPLRIYIKQGEFTTCQCVQQSVQLKGICMCNSLFVFDVSTNSCKCKDIPSKIIYDTETKICQTCPLGCSCDGSGCFQCISSAYRTISLNSDSIYVCHCSSPYLQIQGICSCSNGYKLKDNTCVCQDPYYINQNNTCSCMDKVDSQKYYYDDFQLKCKHCPPGCVCNASGCIDCGSDFLRIIKYSLITFKYRCPCFQNSILVGEYCTICNNNSYPEYLGSARNISCVKCIQCRTCNRYGCLSCPQNMTLVQQSCICNNETLINQDGKCTCPYFHYLTNNVCQPCPLRCNSCFQFNNSVICTSCGLTVNRLNLPAEGCPCQRFFKQASTPSEFCCSLACEQCQKGECLTCPQYTYRSLVNKQCVCTDGFIQQNDTLICLCPIGHYLLNNLCFICPIQCLTCIYDNSLMSIICSSCKDDVNRQKDIKCSCLQYYSQTSDFKSQYCYATHCISQSKNCIQCIQPWQINTISGFCTCRKGYWVANQTDCVACTIEGCLNCFNQFHCFECDQSNNFYLVQTDCSEVNVFNFLAVRNIQKHLILQFMLSGAYSDFQQITVTVNPILKANPQHLQQQLQFSLINKKLLNNGTLISILLQNVNKTYHNIMVTSDIIMSSSNSVTFQKQKTALQFNFRLPILYSTQTFDQLDNPARIALYVLVIIVMIMAFVFYIFGFKHNQACFFMQTMSFACFVIPDTQLSAVIFLYNLRYSYYNFSYNNALSAIVPYDYIERSKGNFSYLTVDANIVRNIGLPIIFALLFAGLSIFFRFFYEITKHKNLIQPAGLATFWKKIIYRAIQFFYKTLMYPLVFFSIQNLFNWKTDVYVDAYFRRDCSIASIIILSIYLMVTIYQYFIELISIFNKYQNLKQFLNVIIGSLILIGSQTHPKVILLFIIIFFASQLPYYRYKLQDLFVFRVVDLIRLLIVVLQIICVILLCTVNRIPLIVIVVLTLFVQMGLLVYKTVVDKHYNMISKLRSQALNQQQEEGADQNQSDNFTSKQSI